MQTISGAKLVFFDNVYAIGGDKVRRITEDSPISPTSKKGKVRAITDRNILTGEEWISLFAKATGKSDKYMSKFEKHFNFVPTTSREGVDRIMSQMQRS